MIINTFYKISAAAKTTKSSKDNLIIGSASGALAGLLVLLGLRKKSLINDSGNKMDVSSERIEENKFIDNQIPEEDITNEIKIIDSTKLQENDLKNETNKSSNKLKFIITIGLVLLIIGFTYYVYFSQLSPMEKHCMILNRHFNKQNNNCDFCLLKYEKDIKNPNNCTLSCPFGLYKKDDICTTDETAQTCEKTNRLFNKHIKQCGVCVPGFFPNNKKECVQHETKESCEKVYKEFDAITKICVQHETKESCTKVNRVFDSIKKICKLCLPGFIKKNDKCVKE